jgi:hypothetical protein
MWWWILVILLILAMLPIGSAGIPGPRGPDSLPADWEDEED